MNTSGLANATQVTVDDLRDRRFGEILVVKEDGVEIYNTTGLNDCPAALWDNLDIDEIKRQFRAKAVQKNGPHFWMMDSQTLLFGPKVSLAGLEARPAAIIDPVFLQESAKGSKPYSVFTPNKTQKQVFLKGRPVFELVDPDGHVYVMQAHDEQFPMASLGRLGERLKQLPAGWKYRTREPVEDLVLDLTLDKPTYAVGDEFHQYYTRIPEGE